MERVEVDVLKEQTVQTAHDAPPISDWGPKGIEFARFHLAGDCDVAIYQPVPGIKDIQVEIFTGCDYKDGHSTRRSTVLRLPKARARAIASAMMGAAAEL